MVADFVEFLKRRFKERDESFTLDIFAAYLTLLCHVSLIRSLLKGQIIYRLLQSRCTWTRHPRFQDACNLLNMGFGHYFN
jgi:hypothetical protein